MNKQKILIIDRDLSILSTLAGFLSDEPYDISTAENEKEGLKILRREKIDLAVAEKDIAGLDGIALLERVAAEKIQTNILIMGSVVPMEVTKEILTAGAVSVLDKPIVKDKFLAEVKTCILLNEVRYKVSRTSEASRSLPRSFQRPLNTGREKVSQEKLASFLEEHYRNSDLKFEDLTNHFKISLSQGHALFKKYFDKTFRWLWYQNCNASVLFWRQRLHELRWNMRPQGCNWNRFGKNTRSTANTRPIARMGVCDRLLIR